LKQHTTSAQPPASSTIEPSGATDDIRYVLNSEPPPVQPPIDGAAGEPQREARGEQPAGAGGLADAVIDSVDEQLPDQTDSTVRGGKVGQESKRGAY
jgi:hypothetical protein